MLDIIEELGKHGELFNKEALGIILKPITCKENLTDKFLEDQRVFYYTAESRSLRDYSFHDTDDAIFKIVKFTNTRNFFNHPWCFGYIKEDSKWRGAYAGCHGELFSKLKAKNKSLLSKVDFPKAISRVDIFKQFDATEFTKTVYYNLVNQEEWGDFASSQGLQIYLQNLTYVARDKTLFKDKISEHFILKQDGNNYTLLFNSGLLDKYYNFIIIRADLSLYNKSFLSEPYYAVRRLSIVTNISDYGLDKPLPVMELCDKAKLVFPSDKINLTDNQGINHIFLDRSNRLTKELQNCSPSVLYTALNYSVDLALKMSKVDTQYLVPFLNMKWDKISYLMPFYVNHIDADNPLCAIVIGEVSPGVWAPVTTLSLDTARSNARLLGRINASWLLNKKGGLLCEDCKN